MRHRRLPRLDLPGSSYYLGCCLHERRPLFTREDLCQLLLDLYVSQRHRVLAMPSEAALWTRTEYLHANPVRGGLVTTSTEYAWSNAEFWETGRGPVQCESMGW